MRKKNKPQCALVKDRSSSNCNGCVILSADSEFQIIEQFFSHSSRSIYFNCLVFLGLYDLAARRLPKVTHTCSIGFKSGSTQVNPSCRCLHLLESPQQQRSCEKMHCRPQK
ncbi:hypothetical protein TNCV_2381941 [Trichonephila clavipes]|nr:hypothetical protein TNCV_2381941 [Trichonephila clavipes]